MKKITAAMIIFLILGCSGVQTVKTEPDQATQDKINSINQSLMESRTSFQQSEKRLQQTEMQNLSLDSVINSLETQFQDSISAKNGEIKQETEVQKNLQSKIVALQNTVGFLKRNVRVQEKENLKLLRENYELATKNKKLIMKNLIAKKKVESAEKLQKSAEQKFIIILLVSGILGILAAINMKSFFLKK